VRGPVSPPDATPQPVEMVRKVFVRDLREKDSLHTVFLVTRKQKAQGRSGKSFLMLTFADKTGEVDARVFDDVDKADAIFQSGDYVLVQGEVITFHGKLQLLIKQVERLDPEPIDASEFAPPPPPPEPERRPEASAPSPHPAHGSGDGERAVAQIRETVERVHDTYVKQLLLAFLDDPEIAPALPLAPAAKGIHHAYKGGLADHLLSTLRLVHRIADHYPMADRDLLVAGALLHDIGKTRELSWDKGGFEYTDEGRLVGHLVMTAQKIREKASRIAGFPALLEQHITHLVLAHHGRLEYGSPKLPMTLEALLVHLVDEMDSRVQSWLEVMTSDQRSDRWTDVSKLYDRHLWKGPLPTARGKSPIDGRRKQPGERQRERRRDRDRKRPARETPSPQPQAAQSDAPPAPPPAPPPKAEPRPERDPSLPAELSFKPFNVLTGEGDR
jgi:3'-5' exoribonuclease